MTEKTEKKRERKRTVRELKAHWAIHHMTWVSDLADDIARAINLEKQNLYALTDTQDWSEGVSNETPSPASC